MKHVLNLPTQTGFVWRVKKDKKEVATGRTWPIFEWSERALHSREYVLQEFWQVFVDDRPVHRHAINTHANVLSKAVFSHGQYLWMGRRRKVGGFTICGMHVDLH